MSSEPSCRNAKSRDSGKGGLVRSGLREGFRASWSIIQVMVPVSFLIAVLKYLGLVKWLGAALTPCFRFWGLPGEAVLALLSGYLVNCYSAIAVMATLALDAKAIAILSIMLLLCHTLPVEMAVQKKAGGSFWVILALRLGSSLLVGVLLNWMLPGDAHSCSTGTPVIARAVQPASFLQLVYVWLKESTVVINLVLLNLLIAILTRFLNHYRILEALGRFFKPLMRLLGLPPNTVFLWMVTNAIGLIYGASMLVEARRLHTLSDTELKQLNLSLATCHSLIQETANFMSIGAPWPVLILPRLGIAIMSVWIYNLKQPSGGREMALSPKTFKVN